MEGVIVIELRTRSDEELLGPHLCGSLLNDLSLNATTFRMDAPLRTSLRRIKMHLGYFTKSGYNGKILAAFLLAMFACGPTTTTDSRANAVPDEWDEVFDTARAVLAKMPDAARIEATIKDSGLRETVLRAYRGLKACAKGNKDQSRAIKQGTLAEFERAFKSVQTEAERSDYQTCASKCKTDGAKCETGCASARKKLCACKLTEFGCFVTQCVFS